MASPTCRWTSPRSPSSCSPPWGWRCSASARRSTRRRYSKGTSQVLLDRQPNGCILESSMDAVFKALADASRRQLLDRLHAENGQTLGELCTGLDMTRQAVTKHLAILEGANLVVARRRGREKLHYINPVPINEIAERWIGKYERHRLKALGELKRAFEGSDE